MYDVFVHPDNHEELRYCMDSLASLVQDSLQVWEEEKEKGAQQPQPQPQPQPAPVASSAPTTPPDFSLYEEC